jgi:hypothetical protein
LNTHDWLIIWKSRLVYRCYSYCRP